VSTETRAFGYVVGCAALFVVAFGVGRLVGPVADEPASGPDHRAMAGASSAHDVGGLAAGPGAQQVAFAVRGEDGDLPLGRTLSPLPGLRRGGTVHTASFTGEPR
jgi:hypothetical protein